MGNGCSIDETQTKVKALPPSLEKLKFQTTQEIKLDQSGFSVPSITIAAKKKFIIFWSNEAIADANSSHIQTYSLVQIVDDEQKGAYHEVIGGIDSGGPVEKARYEITFKLEGTYKFTCRNHPKRPILSVNVTQEETIEVKVTDDGFIPRLLKIDQYDTIRWEWKFCEISHSIYESEYCDTHVGLYRVSKELTPVTTSNNYQKKFSDTGVYYFQTQSKNADEKHICIVQVEESNRDFRIDIRDDTFEPMCLTIEEGDRVWFAWSKETCKNAHCIFEIEIPSPEHNPSDPYDEKENGFKWPKPTKNGLMSNRFMKSGIYYFSDQSEDESASYIGIIIVKPKRADNEILIEQETSLMSVDMIQMEAGQKLWWKWDKEATQTQVKFLEATLLGNKVFDARAQCEKYGVCDAIKSNAFAKLGFHCVKIVKPGVYFYSVQSGPNKQVATIVAYPPERDHNVVISDTEIKKQVLTVHPYDRVWFTWTNTKNSHNIRQVTHKNTLMENSFLSGAMIESPGAYCRSFEELGIYYFRSDGLKNVVGAILVVSEPSIQPIQVTQSSIEPDPLIAHIDDLVLWIFPFEIDYGLVPIKSKQDLVDFKKNERKTFARKFLCTVMKDEGVYHFASSSFNRVFNKTAQINDSYAAIVLSSVIVDKKKLEHGFISIDSNGFHPDTLTISKGKCVLIDWKESDQEHNVVHIEEPIEGEPLVPVKGDKDFNSGALMRNANFMHSFVEEGKYWLTSEGAPGFCCLINVKTQVQKTPTPKLVNQEPYVIDKYHKIHLDTSDASAKIFYTTNGSQPTIQSPNLKIYNRENGILLAESGFCFIRAVALSRNYAISDVFTSQRFYVKNDTLTQLDLSKPPQQSDAVWWQTIPKIIKIHRGNGIFEIFWEKAPIQAFDLIDHYKLYLNGISYRHKLDASKTRVTIKGLMSGREYEAMIMVFPKSASLLAQQSNKLIIKAPLTTDDGAPLISLRGDRQKKDRISIVWKSNDTSIEFFQLIINDEKQELIKADKETYRVVIDNLKSELHYEIILIALTKNGIPLVSNKIMFTVPFNFDELVLPDPEIRKLDVDCYDEFIGVYEIDDERPPQMQIQESPSKFIRFRQEAEKQEKSERLTNETQYLMDNLDAPKVNVSQFRPGSIVVEWALTKLPPESLQLAYFTINLVGTEFGNIMKSDFSFDCFMDMNGVSLRAIQYSWSVKVSLAQENKFVIDGILDTSIYHVDVIAVYGMNTGDTYVEIKKQSDKISHISLGPPNAPRVKVTQIGLQCVTLEWSANDYPKPEYITGYRLLMNGEYKLKFGPKQREHQLSDLLQGMTYRVQLITLTISTIGQSQPSRELIVKCPHKPDPPLISNLPSVQINSVMIGWKPVVPKSFNKEDSIWMYKIYLNDKLHGEIFSSNLTSYSYLVSDLVPGQFYDVTVKTFCGERFALPNDDDRIYCCISSENSNTLPVTPTAPPLSPSLRLESINYDGIDITWTQAQQYGDASLAGYYIIKDGKQFGNLINADVVSTRIRGIRLGETLNLQLLAVTNHPCGQYSTMENHPNYKKDFSLITNNENEIEVETVTRANRYSACKPGPNLVVKYTSLVYPVKNLKYEKVTGYSAVLTWSLDDYGNSFHTRPESYTISYWPGKHNADNVKIITTHADFIELVNLQPSAEYTVRVETRKVAKRFDESLANETQEYQFIYFSRFEEIKFKTGSPPDAPSNISLMSSTCHSIKICWDQPVDNGSELVATRIDCYSLNFDRARNFIKELTPDVSSCVIDGLNEKTQYRVCVTALTREYFIKHGIREVKDLPKHPLEQEPWIPSSHIDVITSGTDPACNLEFKLTHDAIPHLTWKVAKVYGTNLLVSQNLCFHEAQKLDDQLIERIPLSAHESSRDLKNLKVAHRYKFWIESIVSIKLSLDDENFTNDRKTHYSELKDRRTAHILSDCIETRVQAPCETPVVHLVGYSLTTIDLQWPKPLMHTQHQDPEDQQKHYNVHRKLLGYRIEVNGINQNNLSARENECTLINCRPGNLYNVTLIARTCLIGAVTTNGEYDIKDIDESRSKMLQVRLAPVSEDDCLTKISCKFEEITSENGQFGTIKLEWCTNDTKQISQFNVHWFNIKENLSHKKSLDSTSHTCLIPVKETQCLYEIYLESVLKSTRVIKSELMRVQVIGSPEAPRLWLKEQNENMCRIEWCEPRVYPLVPCTGYQIYLNNTKTGDRIEFGVNEASLPLKPNRVYSLAIQALTSRPEFSDSDLSNKIEIRTHFNSVAIADNKQILNDTKTQQQVTQLKHKNIQELREFYQRENAKDLGECSLPLRLKRITEESIELDWNKFISNGKVEQYKVQWHCLNTNRHDEERLNGNSTHFIIKNCIPGYTYALRVTAIEKLGIITNKSKFYLAQMCAPPDTPSLHLRACNFKYITMEWTKPMTYGQAEIESYKMYIDGKAVAILSTEQTSFTLSNGEPCHEYTFQIQATTSVDNLTSPLSAPVHVIWPGVKCPSIQVLDKGNDYLLIGWDEPKIVGNAKVSFYRLISECEQTGQVLVQGPLEATLRECELRRLDAGKHKIHLEVNVYGLTEPFHSQVLYVEFGYKPDAPFLHVQIPSLDERQRLDRIATSLLNKRDRLIRVITYNGEAKIRNKITKAQIEQSIACLGQLEEALDDCLRMIEIHTGYFVVNLSWECEQTNPAVRIVGYRVYVNDKQHGIDLHESIRSIRIKLSLERVKYSIYVCAFTKSPLIESQKSNTIDFLTEAFLPLSYFCYHHLHIKNTTWPAIGCCQFKDSIGYERNNLARTREPVNIGFYTNPKPILLNKVFDVKSAKPMSILDTSKDLKTTVILFWTKWCLPSMKILNFLINYAKRNMSQYEYVACHHGSESLDELRDLLKKTGYIDSNIRFCTDSTELLRIHNIPENSLMNTYDIKGLPLMMITNRDGYLCWKGRHACFEYSQFENFMHHTLSEIIDATCPVSNCDCCQNETNIERELHSLRNEKRAFDIYREKMNRPVSEFIPSTGETTIMDAIVSQGQTIKRTHRSISQSRQLISIRERPYSASSSVDIKLRQKVSTLTPKHLSKKRNSHLHSCEYAAFEAERNGRKRKVKI